MLNVNRAHGRNQHFVVETLSDRKLVVNPDGSMTIAKPVFETRERGGRTEVKMQARTMGEMRGMVSGLEKKFPHIDVEEVMRRAQAKQEYSREPCTSSNQSGPLRSCRKRHFPPLCRVVRHPQIPSSSCL